METVGWHIWEAGGLFTESDFQWTICLELGSHRYPFAHPRNPSLCGLGGLGRWGLTEGTVLALIARGAGAGVVADVVLA